jgi:ubiquinone/menaquinone biosynthesis C-methylase UbiE
MTASLGAATLAAYERWAPLYPPVAHNPLMRAEQQAMLARWPATAGRRALDLASGSGRYSRLLAESGAADVIAVDFCTSMLAQVVSASPVRANMTQLPFQDNAFDVVVCGLAIGHAASLHEWMREVFRVLRPQGTLLYSDFHPEAARAGLTRSFKDQNNQTCTVPHRCYELESQRDSAIASGLRIDAMDEVRVGAEFTEPFPKSEEFYRRWHGLPILLVVSARK